MKLFNLDNSPFAARVRMQIRHKGLPIDFVEPPEELRTQKFREAYPLGKVPALELDNGDMIAESTAIMNYLESVFPETPMRPAGAIEQAQNEMLVRYTDNHLSLGLSPVFQEFFALLNSQQVPDHKEGRFDLLMPELRKLERLLIQLPSYKERELQTGDLCVVGNLYYVNELASYFGKHDVLEGLNTVNSWLQWVMAYPAVATEIDVMNESHRAMVKSRSKQGGKT